MVPPMQRFQFFGVVWINAPDCKVLLVAGPNLDLDFDGQFIVSELVVA
jgi:hypothetical protein